MIYLTFDIEEFDVPRERGLDFSLDSAMKVSRLGTIKILDLLLKHNVKSTLFCTANFVQNAPDLIKRAIDEGHEIACHGVDHWEPNVDDPKVSMEIIEKLTGEKMLGYRQPRMFDVSDDLIEECGYKYNSSLNPAFIPGKYMHLNIPRTPFLKGKVLQIPASVAPFGRIPLFWLSLHDFPEFLYHKLALSVLKHDGYFMTYFHPWEFVDHPAEIRKYMLPIVTHNIGQKMVDRLERLIIMFKDKGQEFAPLKEMLND
ncbi:MAG: polysaccharide deacetylase family protein [Coriobacteriia bacterium]|nr:polysaccharide deacetylase family protein [Coriobacteriia bacterium]